MSISAPFIHQPVVAPTLLTVAVMAAFVTLLRRPPRIAIVDGLVFGQMLTLFTTPVIYLLLDGPRRRFSRERPASHCPGILIHGGAG